MKAEMYLGMKIKRQGAQGDWWAYAKFTEYSRTKARTIWLPRFEAMTKRELKHLIKQRYNDLYEPTIKR